MDIRQFNYIEAGLWFTFSLILLIPLVMRPNRVRFGALLWVAPLTFFVFSLSDVIEAQTGAWWSPWWLLLIKSGCVLSLAWCFWQYRLRK